VKDGINYQPQLVSRISEPSTVGVAPSYKGVMKCEDISIKLEATINQHLKIQKHIPEITPSYYHYIISST